MRLPILAVADKRNNIYDLPGYAACGMSGMNIVLIQENELIPLPPASKLFFLPDRIPIGYDVVNREFHEFAQYLPVAAFIPPGYTQLYSAAYLEYPNAKLLPLYSYSPVAWYKGRLHVPAIITDRRRVHDIRPMDMGKVREAIQSYRKTKNRLIQHLQKCSLEYGCPNAINFFLKRYECPLPSSGNCNANCLGCISYQPEDSCSSSQDRITFQPAVEEIAEIAIRHIKQVRDPVVSFGQGCEGEPLLAAGVIADAIRIIRKATAKGTIHMNTNASLPHILTRLFEAGLDSIRVSMNSARKKYYNIYYRPGGYTFDDVIESIAIAKKNKKFVSLNYLTMPGFTDDAEEFFALKQLIRRTRINMIQWRNLNIDPQYYFRSLGISDNSNGLGISSIIARLKKEFPKMRHGYFNVSVK